jgi:hypothetical protein
METRKGDTNKNFALFVRAGRKLYLASVTCPPALAVKTVLPTNYLSFCCICPELEDLEPETAIASISGFKDGITFDVSKADAEIVQCIR